MIVLALDTSHPRGSAAVARTGVETASVTLPEDGSHMVGLGPAVDRLLAGAGLAVGDVDRIALVIGPGSFTGLRIGLAFAKGLALGGSADLVCMGTLDLLAAAADGGATYLCPMIDARKDQVYGALYRRRAASTADATVVPPPVVPACAADPAAFVQRVVGVAGAETVAYFGTGALRYRDVIAAQSPDAVFPDVALTYPSARLLAELAPGLVPLTAEETGALEPTYLRPTDAVFQKLKRIDERTHHD